MNTRSFLALLASACFATASLAACGDDVERPARDAGGADAALDSSALPSPPRYDGGVEASAPATCGTNTCAPATYQGVVSLAACCTTAQTCGLDLTPLSKLRQAPTSCTALAAPGDASPECPSYSPDGGAGFVYDGCCRPNKTCGVFVKLGEGLDFGCAAAEDFVSEAADAGPPVACGTDGGS